MVECNGIFFRSHGIFKVVRTLKNLLSTKVTKKSLDEEGKCVKAVKQNIRFFNFLKGLWIRERTMTHGTA